jgi:hypothetical protein
MLLQSGIASVATNLIRLIGTCAPQYNISDIADLRRGFIEFLDLTQPRALPRNKQNFEIISDFRKASHFSDNFNNDSVLDDKNQSQIILAEEDDQAQPKKETLSNGIEYLKSLDGGHYHFLSIIATELFVLPSREARAGSTSESIGVIWINPKPTYRLSDVAKF